MLVEPVTGSALGISEAAGAKLWNASVVSPPCFAVATDQQNLVVL